MRAKSLTTTVAGLLVMMGPALAFAESTAMFNGEILLRAEEHRVGGSTSQVGLEILTGEFPTQGGWVETLAPGTEDPAYDGQPAVAIRPAIEAADQRIALVWVREDVELGQRDLALAWMNLPAWEGQVQWVTRTAETPQAPKLLLHANGTQHLLYRRAEDGHLIFLMRSRSGTQREVVDLTERGLQGHPVAPGAYTLAIVEGELLVAAVPDDGSGSVIILGDGPPPNGGDWTPTPLFQSSERLESSGGGYVFSAEDPVPVPSILEVDGLPLVVWRNFDDSLGTEMLHYRFRDGEGRWSSWSRLALSDTFGEAKALESIRQFLLRDAEEGPGAEDAFGVERPSTWLDQDIGAGSDSGNEQRLR